MHLAEWQRAIRLLSRAAERLELVLRRCGARTRAGLPCRNLALPGRKRCRLHGGLSTGPRTVEGKRRVGEAARQRLLARWAKRRAVEAGHG